MVKKRIIENFRTDGNKNCKIFCSRCLKCNTFELSERKSGYMQFKCVDCGYITIMPFMIKR